MNGLFHAARLLRQGANHLNRLFGPRGELHAMLATLLSVISVGLAAASYVRPTPAPLVVVPSAREGHDTLWAPEIEPGLIAPKSELLRV